jgi:hypothetical protein
LYISLLGLGLLEKEMTSIIAVVQMTAALTTAVLAAICLVSSIKIQTEDLRLARELESPAPAKVSPLRKLKPRLNRWRRKLQLAARPLATSESWRQS